MVKESVVSCVLDSEAVAWNREKKQIQPFQVLTTRKRKARGGLLCLIPRPQAVRLDLPGVTSEVAVEVHKSPDCNNILSEGAKKSRAWMQLISRSKCVCVYAFDLLYLNGEPNCQKNAFICSRALLKESFEEKEGEFVFARPIDSDNTDTIVEFLEQSVRGTYGGFLLARYDEDNEEFQSVCKIGTGFKDEDLEEHILPKPHPYHRVDRSTEPDVWLDAVQVWEVQCADLSLSPIYKAGMGLCDLEKGISLRFPRFLRIRDDKKPEDATSGRQIADLYREQQVVQNQGDKADLEDYY
ncbi:DNA ligase 1 isoform X3 [Salmo trutta]|nr:DNA ligase 1-like isoform X3 [Salmo trutta]